MNSPKSLLPKSLLIALSLALVPGAASAAVSPNSAALAQTAPAQAVPAEAAPLETAAPLPQAGQATDGSINTQPAATVPDDGSLPGYTPMKPTAGIGMPQYGEMDFQKQFSETGQYAKWINNTILLPLIVAISLFVLALLGWVIVRYRRSANAEPSRTTHNTFVEVIWTLVPALILVGIAVPSIDLLAKQYNPPPKGSLTVKATGYQWYWGYTYPDNGGFEVVSNMLPEDQATARGEPYKLAVDNRMVVPAGVPIRMQTTGADVIHSFAVPSLWFKMDAVPGRLNEKELFITKPGVYYGQCSELCGARHGFMPITVEALPPAQFAAWVRAQGGTMPGDVPAAPAAAATEAAPADGGVSTSNPAALQQKAGQPGAATNVTE